jgi:hypothetical protein
MQRLLVPMALIVASCGGKSSPGGNGGQPDATTGGGTPDGPITIPDGPIGGTPDGPVSGTPDAKQPGTPDAPVSSTPDAPVSGTPDAPASGTPDGPVSGTADANTGGMCLPTCFIELTSPLISECIPSGSCTQYFSGQTILVCYLNGVKIETTVSSQTMSTVLFKKANGDDCFSIVTTLTSQTSTTSEYKSSSGTTVATVIVPDTSKPNIQDYKCGDSAPVEVDLNNPACQSERDGGVSGPDGGSSCTFSASCTP